MNDYIKDIAHGKRVITPRMKRRAFVNRFKSKSMAIGSKLSKNLKYAGSKIKKASYERARAIREQQNKSGGFYKGIAPNKTPINLRTKIKGKQVKYYKRKGKKYYPVYKKSKKVKRIKVNNSSYNSNNPFGLDF